jgi:hypothetical protein
MFTIVIDDISKSLNAFIVQAIVDLVQLKKKSFSSSLNTGKRHTHTQNVYSAGIVT